MIVTEYAPGHRPVGSVAARVVLEVSETFVSCSSPMASVSPSTNPAPLTERAFSWVLRTSGGLIAVTRIDVADAVGRARAGGLARPAGAPVTVSTGVRWLPVG